MRSIEPVLREHELRLVVHFLRESAARSCQCANAVLPCDFSAQEGEVTATLKLKRHLCEQHFAAEKRRRR